jgi:hypothetical protein
MFNQKWEKAPPSLSNYPKSRSRFVMSPLSQTRIFAHGNSYLILGISIIFGGCSFDFIPPRMDIWHLNQFFQTSAISIFSNSSAATSIFSDKAPNSAAPSEKKTNSFTPGKPRPHVQADPGQIPTDPLPKSPILVPEIPDQDNGEVIVTYKSKIEETQDLIRTINESQLSKEQRDTLNSIHSFLEKAQEAFSQDDMSMAVNLAEKAHTLTKEIVKNSIKP